MACNATHLLSLLKMGEIGTHRDNDTERGKAMRRHRKNIIYKPRNSCGYPKLGKRHGTDPSSKSPEETNPAIIFRLLVSKNMR